jgi:lysophospholipase L1-like esterase
MRIALLLLCLFSAQAGEAARPLKIVCFGDSITGGRPGTVYLHQYLKWSDLLQLAIEVRGGAAQAINSGWAGDSTHGKPSGDPPGAVKRLQKDVLDHKPDICVVLIGGNNFAVLKKEPERRAEVEAAYRADLDGMVAAMQATGIKVLLLQYHAPKAADPATEWSTLDDGNAVIAAVGEAHKAPVLALEPAFAAARAAGASAESLLNQKDGVHLNPYGEVVVARTVVARLRELGWTP